MTVGELKELLEGYQDDLEVRILYQSSYPLVSSVSTAWSKEGVGGASDAEDGVLYIQEGEGTGYGPEFQW